jgi:hypothetical protein
VRRSLFILLCLTAAAAHAAPEVAADGEAIYRDGRLPSGQPLIGERDAGIRVEGAAAACAACHRRSGLGMAEGQDVIPPISGKYLFRRLGTGAEDVDYRYTQTYLVKREPYTEATLERAIRDGIGRDGRTLSYLMPRFKLDAKAMASLVAYLKDLSSGPVPGVTADTLHFATIITPDADPVARQGMLSVLDRFFADKNAFVRGGNKPLHSASGVHYRVTRRWQLHVWQLEGAPDTWEAQLDRHLAAEPVFAVISGLGGKTWAPVHRFCERAAIPCLLPNVDLPVVAEHDFYPLYFSQGVLLEAKLIAARLDSGTKRIVQLYRSDDIGAAAADALSRAARARGLAVDDRPLNAAAGIKEIAAALREMQANDTLVLWLRPQDLADLPAAVPQVDAVFVSGLMGRLEKAPLSAPWRRAARLTYPLDLPEARRVRMAFPLGWFRVRDIPIVAERVQVDTYLACGILAENLTMMQDAFVRDYLLEKIEVMLSQKVTTAYFPRLGLGQGQRFASKGGYLVRFAGPEGDAIVADGNWTVP